MIKKQSVLALVVLMVILLVLLLGGAAFSLINPEVAAGHPNYARNYHMLSLLKIMCLWVSFACAGVLWMLACFLLIRSKKRSPLWLFLAAFGPLGLAVLAMLNDRECGEADRYSRFVRSMNGFLRVAYELGSFVVIWAIAYEAMVLKRTLMIAYEAAKTGVSTAQIMNVQNASAGMWAFGELAEVLFLVALLYLLRPVMFSILGMMGARMASPKPR